MTTGNEVPWQIGEWVADPHDDSLSCRDSTVKIEPRLMQALMCLAQAAPRIVSVEQLLDTVWHGVIVGPASVYQSISQLRRMLGEADPATPYIETVPRKGYRLVASARRIATVPSTDASDRGSAFEVFRSRHWPWLCAVGTALIVGVAAGWQLSHSLP